MQKPGIAADVFIYAYLCYLWLKISALLGQGAAPALLYINEHRRHQNENTGHESGSGFGKCVDYCVGGARFLRRVEEKVMQGQAVGD